jgi:hypothetical protein
MLTFRHDGSGLPEKGALNHWLLALAVIVSTLYQIAIGTPAEIAWCIPLLAYGAIGVIGEILSPHLIAPLALTGLAGSGLGILINAIPDEQARGLLSPVAVAWTMAAGMSIFKRVQIRQQKTQQRR